MLPSIFLSQATNWSVLFNKCCQCSWLDLLCPPPSPYPRELKQIVQDIKYFQRVRWQYMILDEAQAIKSSSRSAQPFFSSLLPFSLPSLLCLLPDTYSAPSSPCLIFMPSFSLPWPTLPLSPDTFINNTHLCSD